MPTNAERREAAQRKLEQQLEQSAQREKRQRLLTVVGAVTAIAVAAAAIAFFVFAKMLKYLGHVPITRSLFRTLTGSCLPAAAAPETARRRRGAILWRLRRPPTES